jgi:hypothetical protein
MSSKPSGVLALTAICISVATAIGSAYFANLQNRTSIMPTLVFVYSDDKGWELRNVGTGPALDPIVSHADHGSEKWLLPTRVYPLEGNGGKISLFWVGTNPEKIVVKYKDAVGRFYMSTVKEDKTTIAYDYMEPSPLWDTSQEMRIWERQPPLLRAKP